MNLVVGKPLDHSLSPRLHNFVYDLENINATMEKFEEADIKKIISRIKAENIELTAVTMPHKEKIIAYLDEVEAGAKEIASVNTIVNRGGKLFGYNTDLVGIARALSEVEIKNRKILLLGAGGVARTVAYFVKQNKGELLIFNRSAGKAIQIVQEFGGEVVSDLEKVEMPEINLIINCTPIGMGEFAEQLPLPEKYLNKNQVIFDIIYNPFETKLLKAAKLKSAKTISGLEMFIAQGVRQVELWQSINIDIEKYVDKLREILIKNLSSIT